MSTPRIEIDPEIAKLPMFQKLDELIKATPPAPRRHRQEELFIETPPPPPPEEIEVVQYVAEHKPASEFPDFRDEDW